MKDPRASVIAVVGAGEIGAGLTAVFADAGVAVWVADPDPGARTRLQSRVNAFRAEMAAAGLAQDLPGGEIQVVAAVGNLPRGVDLAIEAGPEDVAIKRDLFATLRTRLGPDTPIVTTSSAITISQIVEAPGTRRACLVVHPANPPALIRVVECVPAPETDPAVTRRVSTQFEAVGFAPVLLGREVEGFALNRLQSALLREAYRLVESGVVDVAGADRLVSEGLGPRWALSGPFETADLNTPGGIAEHVQRMGPAYARIGLENGERGLPWTEALVADVVAQRRAMLPEDERPARLLWRRRALAQILKTRRRAQTLWRDGAASDG